MRFLIAGGGVIVPVSRIVEADGILICNRIEGTIDSLIAGRFVNRRGGLAVT
jgi:hypothetical protein